MMESSKQPEFTLRCKYCGHGIHEDVISAAFWMDDGLIVVEDVLAQICDGCGEQFLDEETSQRIQALLKNPKAEPKRRIRVSVYDLLRVESSVKRRPLQTIRSSDPEASLPCTYCQSQTVEELVRSAFWVNGRLIAIENIPARVCPGCNVQFYDDATAETIATFEGVRTVPDAARRNVMVSVLRLADKEQTVDNGLWQDTGDHLYEG